MARFDCFVLKSGFSQKKKLGTLLKMARCLKDTTVLDQFCAETGFVQVMENLKSHGI